MRLRTTDLNISVFKNGNSIKSDTIDGCNACLKAQSLIIYSKYGIQSTFIVFMPVFYDSTLRPFSHFGSQEQVYKLRLSI